MTSPTPEIWCFGEFELDLGAYELRRGNLPLKLARQQMDQCEHRGCGTIRHPWTPQAPAQLR